MKQHWVRLQLRFEAPKDVGNAIASGSLKWQYIAIIVTFSSIVCIPHAVSSIPLVWCQGRDMICKNITASTPKVTFGSPANTAKSVKWSLEWRTYACVCVYIPHSTPSNTDNVHTMEDMCVGKHVMLNVDIISYT